MFDEPKPGTVEDIFASTAPAPATHLKTDRGEGSGASPSEEISSISPTASPPILEAGTSKGRRTILILAVVLIVALAAGGAWAYMKFYKTDNPQVPDNEAAPSTAQPSGANQPSANVPVTQPSPTEPPTSQTPPAAQPQDSDHDGLTDQEEASLGTSPTNVDTDFDGLFDYEEAKTFKTNPLRADTDGDGFSDGQEVKNGYNPNGDGKLNEIKP
ncbi:MAG: hypothetical protein WC659_06235 [Patescibacteria group bacterium]